MSDPMIYVRAIHFAATMMAAGIAFFMAGVAEPALRGANSDTRVAAIVRSRLAWIAWTSLALAMISGAAWLVLTAASMSGRPAAEIFRDRVLWIVLLDTDFGRDWLLRLALAGVLAVTFVPVWSAYRVQSSWLKATMVALGAALVGSLAWAGHAVGGQGVEGIVHPAADVLHLVAAAAWVGTLVPLALLLGAVERDQASVAIARTATVRFSTMGIVSVAMLLLTGIANTWYLAGSVAALAGTDYGRLLLLKIVVFFGMIAIATVNRLRLTPSLVKNPSAAATQDALRQLRRNAAIEALLGAVIIAIVAALGTLPPASHAHLHGSNDAIPADAAFQHIHSDQGIAEVTIEPGRVGTARATIRLLNDDLETLDALDVTLMLTAPTPGSKPTAHVALRDPDREWHVDAIQLSEPGNWMVEVDAVLSPDRRLKLAAPIVIDAK